MQAVESAVDRVAAAGSWDEVRRHLHADQTTLLSPVTETYLAFARARYPAGGVGLTAACGGRSHRGPLPGGRD